MTSKLKQRLGGAVLIAIGAGFTVYEWHGITTTGMYHPKAAFLFPACAVLGFAPLLYPMSKEELLAKYGVERPASLRHYSWGQKVVLLLAVAAGALNWALMSGTLSL